MVLTGDQNWIFPQNMTHSGIRSPLTVQSHLNNSLGIENNNKNLTPGKITIMYEITLGLFLADMHSVLCQSLLY